MSCKYTAINLMLPTRKRLAGLERFTTSAIHLAADASRLRFSFLVDVSDIETLKWVNDFQWNHKHIIIDHRTDGPHLARYYNRLYAESIYKDEGTLVSMVSDDMYFDTQGWDRLVLDRINQYHGNAYVFGDDCYLQHGNMAVNGFTTRTVVEGIGTGEFMWGRWRANMIDVVWTEIARRAGILEYIPELHVVHDHQGKKTVKDETHLRLKQHYTFAAGRWHILDPYINMAVESLRQKRIAR